MTRITVDAATFDGALARAASTIRAGRIVAFPTDTLYALGVDPRSNEAVAALFAAKGRTESQAVALIAASVEQAREVGEFTPLAERLASRWWPGPLTIIVAARPGLAAALLGGSQTIGVRVPRHPLACALAERCGTPVTSTSANRSGQPPTESPDVVARTLGDVVDLLLDQGPSPGGAPSTLVDATRSTPRLVRDGAVPWSRVLESVE